MRLENKIALVTGGARGIGYAIVESFVQQGARVIVADKIECYGQAMRQKFGPQVHPLTIDVTQEHDLDILFEDIRQNWGKLHILISNAGEPFKYTLETTDHARWTECMDLNLKATWCLIKRAKSLMQKAGSGSIITIASKHAFRSTRASFPYSVAKGGLLALTKSMAVELAGEGIRANAIIPGMIESVRTEPYFNSFANPEQARKKAVSTYPLGRLGHPRDIAQAALFLASDESEWITGTELLVDGGQDAMQMDLSDL